MKFRLRCALLALLRGATVSAAASAAAAGPLVFCVAAGPEDLDPGPWDGASAPNGRFDREGVWRE